MQKLNKELEDITSNLKKFTTNIAGNTLENKIKQIFENDTNIEYFDILTGFFRISGFNKIEQFLSTIEKTRILIGINTDYQVYEAHKIKEKIIQEQIEDFNTLTENKSESINKLVEFLKNEKVQLKIVPQNNNHSKLYILRNEKSNQGSVIIGSSNLTNSGLEKNLEINTRLQGEDYIDEASQIFNVLWKNAVEDITLKDIEDKIIPNLKNYQKKQNYQDENLIFSDVFYYILIKYFEDIIDNNLNIDSKITLFDYQKDAVNSAILKLNRYNGAILGDVVGLGKTVIAVAIAKKLNYKTLVIAPPSVHTQWKQTFNDFNIQNFQIVSYDKLPNNSDEELIIIDESHKLKESKTNRYEKIQKICKFPFRKKVLLLSATLQNNSPKDIENQIYLFQDNNNSNIPNIVSLEKFFAPLKSSFNNLKKETNKEVINKTTQKIAKEIKQKVLKHLLIRRTRTDIVKHSMYKKDIEKFPKVNQIKSIRYELDDLSDIYKTSINIISSKLKYEKFRILNSLNEKGRNKYKIVNPIISNNIFDDNDLSTLAKYAFIKRFESSFGAFKISLDNSIKSLEFFIKNLKNNHLYIGEKSKEVLENQKEKYIYNEKENTLTYINSKTKKEIKLRGIIISQDDLKNAKKYLKNLEEDLGYLKKLKSIWKDVKKDSKLDKLKDILEQKQDEKIIIFTEYTDTLNYLEKNLSFSNILFISSENRKQLEDVIYKNFDANCPKEEQENNYQILITTDTLAEGVNLHRSNTLINYDLPWNSTKLMQRLGRINRIGSKFDELDVSNFMPVNQSNEVIRIEEKSYVKLQSFHHTLGEDSKILFNDEEITSFGIEEDKDEELEYLQIIRDFKKNYPKEFENLKKQFELSISIPQNEEKELYFFKLGKISYFYQKNNDTNNGFNNIDFLTFIKNIINIDKSTIKQVESKTDEAIEFYKNKIEVDRFLKNNKTTKVTPTDKKAIYLLDKWYKEDYIDKTIKETSIDAIKNKTLSSLNKKILELQNKKKEEVKKELNNFVNNSLILDVKEEKIVAKAYIKMEK